MLMCAPVGTGMPALCRNEVESSRDPGGAEEMETEEAESVNTIRTIGRVLSKSLVWLVSFVYLTRF